MHTPPPFVRYEDNALSAHELAEIQNSMLPAQIGGNLTFRRGTTSKGTVGSGMEIKGSNGGRELLGINPTTLISRIKKPEAETLGGFRAVFVSLLIFGFALKMDATNHAAA